MEHGGYPKLIHGSGLVLMLDCEANVELAS